jgi:excinuclease ABC subunit C
MERKLDVGSMKNDPTVNDLAHIAADRYPHIKLTNEEYPRALATRRIENDDDEYYGAFLPKTAARILIDFLSRTFRLRSCDIPIDGKFAVPCTQYFRRRCVAPCVESICSRGEYLRLVELVQLFLADARERFKSDVETIIAEFSKLEDFERAAHYRDIAIAVDKFWNEQRKRVWLDDAVDTFDIGEDPDSTTIFLVTHRGRKVLGRKVFLASRHDFPTTESALCFLIDKFYLFHLPKELRIPVRLPDRATLEDRLSKRFGRQARITISDPVKKGVNAFRGLNLAHAEHLLDNAKPIATWKTIASELKNIFGLKRLPRRVEAFDVAHISGTGFVAASSVWVDGHFEGSLYRFRISSAKSELQSLAEAVVFRLADKQQKPSDLILIDGGKGQLNAVMNAVAEIGAKCAPFVAAVKPRLKHSSIAAFLTQAGGSVPFTVDSPSHAMLQLLRDEAHDLANRVHRDYREMLPFYEARGFDTPLIVPIRLHAENGGAEDLVPIPSK